VTRARPPSGGRAFPPIGLARHQASFNAKFKIGAAPTQRISPYYTPSLELKLHSNSRPNDDCQLKNSTGALKKNQKNFEKKK